MWLISKNKLLTLVNSRRLFSKFESYLGSHEMCIRDRSSGTKEVTVPEEEAPANYVPAAAVIRRGLSLIHI